GLTQLLLPECCGGLRGRLRLPGTLRLDLLRLLRGLGFTSCGTRRLHATHRPEGRRPELEPGEGGLRRPREIGQHAGVLHAPRWGRPRGLRREGGRARNRLRLEVGAEVLRGRQVAEVEVRHRSLLYYPEIA